MNFKIRKAVKEDLHNISEVHLNTLFQEGIDEFIDYYKHEFNSSKFIDKWENIYKSNSLIYVAEIDEKIVAFCAVGSNLDKEFLEFESEMLAIHCLKEYRKFGIGKALFNQVINEMKNLNVSSMILWSPDFFNDKIFYEKMGGQKITEKKLKLKDSYLSNLGYVWYDFNEDYNKI